MARSEHQPVYKASYDLCLYFEQIVRNFSRYHKYSLGTDLRDGARRVLKLIARANSRREKAPLLVEIRDGVEELKVILRLGHDVKAFSNSKSFEHAIQLVTDIAKQNEGWLKSQGHGQNRRAMPEGQPRRASHDHEVPLRLWGWVGGWAPRVESVVRGSRRPPCGGFRKGGNHEES